MRGDLRGSVVASADRGRPHARPPPRPRPGGRGRRPDARAGARRSGLVRPRRAAGPGTRVATRALGARDLAIGLGTAYAAGQGDGARPWLLAGVLADATDLAATLRARDDLSAAAVAGVGVIAGGSVLLGLWFQAALD